MLRFNDYGILDAGVHACTFHEAAEFLCGNQRRLEIWQGLTGFLEWSKALPSPTAYLLDGSFVTDKAAPSDVDVVVDITSCSKHDRENWINVWRNQHDHVKESYLVDFYPFIVGEGNDFSAFFQYVRMDEALRRGIPPEIRKGILRVDT